MAFVYLLDVTYNDDIESYSTAYDSHDSSMNAAIDQVVSNLISYGFDDSDCPELYELYEEIIEAIQDNNFESALEKYNDIPDVTFNYEGFEYINVYTKVINSCVITHTLPQKLSDISAALAEVNSQKLSDISATTVSEGSRQEVSCIHCGRLNDVGVGVCWCCGNVV